MTQITCKYNDHSVFDKQKIKNYKRVIRLRNKLQKIEEKFNHYYKTKKGDPQFLAFEKQHLQNQIKYNLAKIKPALVK